MGSRTARYAHHSFYRTVSPFLLLLTLLLAGGWVQAGDDTLEKAWSHAVPVAEEEGPLECAIAPYERLCAKPLIAVDDLPERYRTIIKGIPVMQMYGAGVMGIFLSLPEDISNWDTEAFRSKPLWRNWYDNVRAGPVWDADSWFINYVEHPYVGSAYYVWGREAGMSWKEALGLSIFFSAVYWEYGWESLIEPPSIQDLVVTPLVGSLAGELAFRMKQRIVANGGILWGSRWLGGVAKFFLDPIGETNAKLAGLLREHHFSSNTTFEFFYAREISEWTNNLSLYNDNTEISTRIGFRAKVRF